MNAEEYKQLINEKDVLDYSTLNITLKELAAKKEARLADAIQTILKENKIEKPELPAPTQNLSTNYYKVNLPAADIESIADLFFDLEESFLTESGEATPTASFYAALADKWNNLL